VAHLGSQLEARTLEEVREAMAVVAADPDPETGRICRIMLDNMTLDAMKEVKRGKNDQLHP
jgi:nicotinate-nucleotide pyrophosphorylase